MRRLNFLKLSGLIACLILLSCNNNQNPNPKPEPPAPLSAQEIEQIAYNAVEMASSSKIEQAIATMEAKFSELSAEQINKIKDILMSQSGELSKETAENISHTVTSQAIADMKKEFALFSETQIKAIRAATVEIASQISENVAKDIARRDTGEAIATMEQKFETLSEEQKTIAKEEASQVAQSTAQSTAQTVASEKTDQAIANMEQDFQTLSEEQKTLTIEQATQVAQNTAKTTAQSTAQLVAARDTGIAIASMNRQFETLSEEQKTIAKEEASQVAQITAQNTAQTLASEKTDQAIANMKQDFQTLSEEQKIIAQSTAEVIAQKAVDSEIQQAIANMEQQLSTFEKETEKKFTEFFTQQIQLLKTATLEIASQVAENTSAYKADQAISDLKEQFEELAEIQKQEVTENTTQIARETAQITSQDTIRQEIQTLADNFQVEIQQFSTNLQQETQQFTTNLRSDFSEFLKEQLQTIESNTLSQAESTSREVTDKTLDERIKQRVLLNMDPILQYMDSAIEDMQYKQAELLNQGLQKIISVAMESLATEILKLVEEESPNPSSKEDKALLITTATHSTVESAKEILSEFEKEAPSQNPEEPLLDLFFEQCSWENQEYTTRIVKEHDFFPLSDPLQQIVKNWDREENETTSPCTEGQTCAEPNTKPASLSPLYDNFVLSLFQESIKGNYFYENDIPLECFFAGAVRGANIYSPGNHFYYCEKDSDRQSSRMSVTDDKDQERNILPRRACLNRDYTYLTATAFNKTADCFGFQKAEKEALFKLLNHESTFLHNIKSPTGAKCYGQLTTIAIDEINKQIYFSDSANPLPYSYIFDDVIEKCPGLQHVILNPEIYEPEQEGTKKSLSQFEQIISNSPINCKITQNPYSCLFYTFYNFKKSFDLIDRQLNLPTSNFNEQNNITQDFEEYFLLPIPLNRMLSVTSPSDREMLFWDDSEIWGSLRQSSLNGFRNIEVLPLFENEPEVRRLFSVWSYNGGISISSSYMRSFIKQLKRRIASPCNPSSQNKYCQYRFRIMEGQGISTRDVREDFKVYIRNNYQIDKVSNGRRKEVTEFTNHVEKNLNYIYDKNGLFRVHLNNMAPDLEAQDIEDFQNHLTEVCPQALL